VKWNITVEARANGYSDKGGILSGIEIILWEIDEEGNLTIEIKLIRVASVSLLATCVPRKTGLSSLSRSISRAVCM